MDKIKCVCPVTIDRNSLSEPCANAWEALRSFHVYVDAQKELDWAENSVSGATKAAFTEGCRQVFAKDRSLSYLTWYIPEEEDDDAYWGQELNEHPCAINILFEDHDYHREMKQGRCFYDFGELGEMRICDIRDVFGDGKLTVRRDGATISIG